MGDWSGSCWLCMGCQSSSGMVLASAGLRGELLHKGRAWDSVSKLQLSSVAPCFPARWSLEEEQSHL